MKKGFATILIITALLAIVLVGLIAYFFNQPNKSVQQTNNPKEIDYYSCKDLESLPFQYIESLQLAIGYLDISGTLETRADKNWYTGSDEEIKGVYFRIPVQKEKDRSLFYSQFIEEAKNHSANAEVDEKDLLFRLGKYDNKSLFSSAANVPSNFQLEMEKAINSRKIINLHLVISVSGGTEAPSNTTAACKINLL